MSPPKRPPRNDHKKPRQEVQPVIEIESDSSLSDEEDDEEDDDEYVVMDLSDLKELKCAICLGIIRNTRTVAECLHRFCKECIEKSMRLGINECPICRVHVPSRRSLREDTNFDNLISALVPDIDKYEEQEELAFVEEGSSLNKEKIEASSVQNLPCQTEASDRKQKAKTEAVASERMRRSEGKNAGKLKISNENEALNDNNAGKDLRSGEEKTETRPRKGGERDTQVQQKSVIIDVDREISSSANVHRSNTVLNDKEKTKQEMSKNVSISRILNNDSADKELEKYHVGGVQALGLGSVRNDTFQSTRSSDSFSNLDSTPSSQLKEEVISLRRKLTILQENFKILRSAMLTYVRMKEGHIPSELSIIFGATTNAADEGSG